MIFNNYKQLCTASLFILSLSGVDDVGVLSTEFGVKILVWDRGILGVP